MIDKQAYMNRLYRWILRAEKEGDAVALEALLSSYDSKLRMGWPSASFLWK